MHITQLYRIETKKYKCIPMDTYSHLDVLYRGQVIKTSCVYCVFIFALLHASR